MKEFTCPKCGSHYFYSEHQRDPNNYLVRYCVDKYGMSDTRPGCGFTWSEKDDEKYLKDVPPPNYKENI